MILDSVVVLVLGLRSASVLASASVSFFIYVLLSVAVSDSAKILVSDFWFCFCFGLDFGFRFILSVFFSCKSMHGWCVGASLLVDGSVNITGRCGCGDMVVMQIDVRLVALAGR